jgi:hypothetical protein
MEKQLRNYWCKNKVNNKECQFCNKGGDLQIDAKEHEVFKCPNNSEVELKFMGIVMFGKLGAKMSPTQVQSERKKRSTEDFKKNIFPKFEKGSDESNHFRKKLNIKD